MREVNVNRLVTDLEPSDISASVAERGANAGSETWANSMKAVAEYPLLKENEREAVRGFFAEFGAWDEEEVAAWSDNELDALVLQFAAGDLRELQALAPGEGLGGIDWDEAEKLSQDGVCGGRLFVSGDELYVTLD